MQSSRCRTYPALQPADVPSLRFAVQLLRPPLTLQMQRGISMLEGLVMRSPSRVLVSGLCWRCYLLTHSLRPTPTPRLQPSVRLRPRAAPRPEHLTVDEDNDPLGGDLACLPRHPAISVHRRNRDTRARGRFQRVLIAIHRREAPSIIKWEQGGLKRPTPVPPDIT